MLPVDELAQEIRRVDGSNSLGAGALAEALMPFFATREAEAGAVKVKPLEWQYDSFQEIWRGWSSIGTYAAWELNGIGIVRMRYGGDGIVVGKTIEDAKAYAQKDFEQCILSALASPPAPHVAEIPEWRTIESAPLDGREIIVGGCKYGASVRVVHWGAASFNRKTKSYDQGWTDGATWGFEPTHWMPLPAAPHHKREGGNT